MAAAAEITRRSAGAGHGAFRFASAISGGAAELENDPFRSLGRLGGIGKLLRETVAAGYLLTETRTRFSRTGRFSPVSVYRLNRRHPRVMALLEESDQKDPA